MREWKLLCPKKDTGKKDASGEPIKALDLVFPNGIGKVEALSNIMRRGFDPVQVAAGVTALREAVSDAGEPVSVVVGKYGMHALRHSCASLWIESGKNPKQIQTLMGHSTIQMTYDVYGHLFLDAESDQRAAEDIQVRLLGK